MIQIEEKKNRFKNKNVVVVGLARSGVGAANLLSYFGANVSITDTKSRNSLEANIRKLLSSIKVITDGNPEEIFNRADLIIVSPGVPLDIPPIAHARIRGIPVIGELELAYQVIQSTEPCLPAGRHRTQNTEKKQTKLSTHNSKPLTPYFIGVTGTNGKSTTTALIDLMFKESGFETLLGGNIGNALTEEIYSRFTAFDPSSGRGFHGSRFTETDYIVAELSSFQLESIKEFSPRVAAILNITPDHLDRYDSMEDYTDAKARIFENQAGGDYLLLNADDPITMKVRSEKLEVRSKKPRVLYFSCDREVEGVYFQDGQIYCNFPDSSLVTPVKGRCPNGTLRRHSLLINVDEIKIKGIHNLENAMAASAVAFVSGCSPDAVRRVLKGFAGLEHRVEYVGEVNGVKFINDSKGTNIGAVIKSLENFENVILIMGGIYKGGDFLVLQDLIRERVKVLVLLGEAKEKIARAVGGVTETLVVNDLDSAVEVSVSRASAGDVVLLSPGCASFDMFADFKERGRRFKEAVRAIMKEVS